MQTNAESSLLSYPQIQVRTRRAVLNLGMTMGALVSLDFAEEVTVEHCRCLGDTAKRFRLVTWQLVIDLCLVAILKSRRVCLEVGFNRLLTSGLSIQCTCMLAI